MNSANNKTVKNICRELLMEFVNLFVGNVYNKIGFSVLLLVISLILFLSPIQNVEVKPTALYVIASILPLISFYLIFQRFKELKRQKNDGHSYL